MGRRKDPEFDRPVEFGTGMTSLLNRDPDRHYVLVAPFPRREIQKYFSMGYEIETAEAGGVRLNGVRTKEGENIEFEDCVLMSIPLRANPADPDAPSKEKIDRVGPYGDAGWALSDKWEKRIINKQSVQEDLMRGFKGGRYVNFESEIGALTSAGSR